MRLKTEHLRDAEHRGLGLWAAVLVVFPLIYWFPALIDEFAHLGVKTTDIDGDFHFAWLLHNRGLGFGKQFLTNIPHGESLWRWQTYTHFLPVFFIWVMGLVVGPILAVKTYAVAGWILSGWVVARATRCFGVDRATAVVTALLFQVLPWNRYLMENWIHYAWSGLPLLVVLLWLNHEKQDRWRLGFVLRLVLVFLAATLVDGYWMYYTGFLILAMLGCDAWTLLTRFRHASVPSRIVSVVVVISTGITAYVVCRATTDALSESNGLDRRLEPTPKVFLDTYGGRILDFLTPDYRHLIFSRDSRLVNQGWEVNPIQYVGVSVMLLAALGFVWGWRKHREQAVLMCVAITVMLSLSLRSDFFGVPTLAGLVRPFTPGLQWTWRASIICQAGIVILAGLGIQRLKSNVRQGHLVALLVVIVALVDLNPLGGRSVVDQSRPWVAFRKILAAESSPRVLFVPSVLPTQSWIEQVFVQVPMVNGLYDRQSSDELRAADAMGQCDLYRLIEKMGVTHLIVLTNQSVVLPGYEDLTNLRPGHIPNALFPVRAKLQTKIVGKWNSWVELRVVSNGQVLRECQS